MANIMVIGAATGQVPLIRKIRAMGHRAFVVSCPGPYPGFAEADVTLAMDINDRATLRRLTRQCDISAVVTDQSDICLPVAAEIAHDISKPGVPLKLASLFTDKQKVRELCKARNVRTTRSHKVMDFADLEKAARIIGYPLVLKPVDNDGSRGVQLIRSSSTLACAYNESRKFSASGVLLAEEYVSGIELAVEAVIYKSKVKNLVAGVTEKVCLSGLFVPCARLFPADLPGVLDRLFEANTRLYEAHGDFFALTHAEYIVSDRDGQPYLIDAHMRGGGAYIASHIVPLVTGIDLYHLYVRSACNQEIKLPDVVKCHRYAGYMCFLLPEGRLMNTVDSSTISSLPGVEECNLAGLHVGLQLPAPRDKRSRFGPIVISAESAERIEDIRKQVEQAMPLHVCTRSGTLGPIWH